jgi:hypothetical protein
MKKSTQSKQTVKSKEYKETLQMSNCILSREQENTKELWYQLS